MYVCFSWVVVLIQPPWVRYIHALERNPFPGTQFRLLGGDASAGNRTNAPQNPVPDLPRNKRKQILNI
jgi:hypothetical protein